MTSLLCICGDPIVQPDLRPLWVVVAMLAIVFFLLVWLEANRG